MAFHFTKRKLGASAGYISFVAYWMAFEYLHLNWEITWPWLTLGNVFSLHINWVQWYEFTGVQGGTLWILLMNLWIFLIVKKAKAEDYSLSRLAKAFIKPTIAVLIPIAISYFIWSQHEENGIPQEVVVAQPNIDPYKEKFVGKTKPMQMEKLVSITRSKCTPETDWIAWPETSIPYHIWLNRPLDSKGLLASQNLMDSLPNACLVAGVTALRHYEANENEKKPSATARAYKGRDGFYDVYNSSIRLQKGEDLQFYHKSKLVPGVERLPYPGFFGFLTVFTIDLGGVAGSLGLQGERDVFYNKEGIAAAPVICYESVFGEYVTEYIKKGAGMIFIVTNDAWWHNTPGHRQHNQYAKLRAVETRRSIARSANTGISCYIDQAGKVHQATEYETERVLSGTIMANDKLTFYTRFGDYMYRVAVLISIILFLYSMVSRFTSGFKFQNMGRPGARKGLFNEK